ncbi:MAG: hypothetical protein HFH14_03355 [Lachnospiraceae bacterium]|nr:hypothetical protein [Lachnospiraceae bacterium]
MDDKKTFEEEISESGRLVYTNVGTSMMPLLRQNRDLMIIRKPDGRCQRYDVPLYKRNDGKYVLHRILKVNNDSYVLCGDNCRRREYGITDRQIIGVLSAVVRDGRTIPVSDWRYRVYAHIWCDFFYIRVIILWLKEIYGRLKRKLKR